MEIQSMFYDVAPILVFIPLIIHLCIIYTICIYFKKTRMIKKLPGKNPGSQLSLSDDEFHVGGHARLETVIEVRHLHLDGVDGGLAP